MPMYVDGDRREDLIRQQIEKAGRELLSWSRRDAEGDPLFDELGRQCSREAITEAARKLSQYGLTPLYAKDMITDYVFRETGRKAYDGEPIYPVKADLIAELVGEGFEEQADIRARDPDNNI